MKIIRLAIYLSVLLIFCSIEINAQTDTDKATVYFYRVEEVSKLDSRKVKVQLGGKHFIDMPEDNFIGVRLAPGKYELKMRQKQSEMLLQVEAGKTYYVRVSQVIAGFGFNQMIYMMQPEQAVFQMRDMKALEDKNIKDKSQEFVKSKPQI